MPKHDDPSNEESREEEVQAPQNQEETPEPPESQDDDVPKITFGERLLQSPLFYSIYRYLYFLGLQVLRYIRHRVRKISDKCALLRAYVRKDVKQIIKSIRIGLRTSWRSVTSPLREMRGRFRDLAQDIAHERKYGTQSSQMKSWGSMAWFLFRHLLTALRWLLNYLVPIALCLFVYQLANTYASQTYVLRLEYNGEEIGYISDEGVFNQAKNAMKGRLLSEAEVSPITFQPHYELVVRDGEQLLTVDRLTDILIRSSGNELLEADGVYIETAVDSDRMELLGAVEDGQELLLYLDTLREQNRTSSMGSNARIEFLKKIQIRRGLYPVGAVKPVGEIKAALVGEERGESFYTVVEGDTPLRIAAKNGLSTEELQAMNPDVDLATSLFPGDQLLVSRSVPKLAVKVTTTSRYQEEIPYPITQETVSTEPIGWTNKKQSGKEGIREYTAEIVYIDGVETQRSIVDQRTVREPVEEILEVGGSRPLTVVPKDSSQKVPSGAFAWPTAGGRISPGFMGYYGHTGSDISFSGCYGTPVYASASGTVVRVKYGTTGYGYHVIIDHGNGLRTLYAHCSELFVTQGQQVSQGQQIGSIGRTGNVTGPHLHFEVLSGGVAVNAASYLYS